MSIASVPNTSDCVVPDWRVPDNVVALSTTRRAGAGSGAYKGFNLASHVGDDPSAVSSNRESLLELLDPGVKLQWLQQVHGTNVVTADKDSNEPVADGCFTTRAGIACCVATADCLPVLMTNSSGTAVAATHAGWRGLAAGILEQTLASFSEPATQIHAWLGPAIGPCHFEVGEEVRDVFLGSPDGAGTPLARLIDDCFTATDKPGKYMADLYGLARCRLAHYGVTNISGGGYCTYCQPDDFYSFRRNNITGRMTSLIYLKP